MAETTKKPKKKGPIRTEAVLPFTIVVALIWAYFFFFFDLHFRHALEYIGTQGNGAEVNIASLHTSFWKASLDINGIQVTSATEPAKNKIVIGHVRWKMLWDALLRGKIVVDEASVNEIALGAPRARPGRVLPPPPPPSDKPSAFTKAKDEALKRAEEEFNKNVLGDAAGLLRGADPASELDQLKGSLKSSLRVKELEAELQKKEKEWNDRIAKLPQQKDLQALQDKLKTVKLDKFNNPAEVQQSLQQLDAIFKEADAKVKEVQSTQAALGGDLNTYQNSLKELQDLAQQDLKDLESKLKLPKLDVATLSRTLFGPMLLGKVKQAEFYMNKAREYMPPKKSKAEKAEFAPPTPHERAKGRNYQFGRPNAYPLFWLKKAQISSKSTPGADLSGDLVGTITDVATDPPLIGRPLVATFKGEFPKQGISGVDGKLTIDHVTEHPVESLNLTVGRFPIDDRKLVESPDVKLGLQNAAASTTFEAKISGDEIGLKSVSGFAPATPTSPFLMSEASQPILADILKGALKDISKVTLNASVAGPWTGPKFEIDSNLGRELASAFDKQLQLKVAEARAKLQNFMNDQVGKEKEKLNAEFNKYKGQIDKLLKDKQDEINKAKGSIDKAKNDAVNSQKKGLEQQGKKAIDDIKKKFGF